MTAVDVDRTSISTTAAPAADDGDTLGSAGARATAEEVFHRLSNVEPAAPDAVEPKEKIGAPGEEPGEGQGEQSPITTQPVSDPVQNPTVTKPAK